MQKKGTINVRLSKSQLSSRRKKWKAKKSHFGSGTLWKYAQTVGQLILAPQLIQARKKKLKNIQKFDEN